MPTLRGFSYIEVVLTLGMLALILVLFNATLQVLPAGRFVRHEDTALRIATHELETLRGAGYAALPASGDFADSMLSQLPSGSATLTVTAYNASTKQVVVTVAWSEPESATPKSVALTTLITQTGGLP